MKTEELKVLDNTLIEIEKLKKELKN